MSFIQLICFILDRFHAPLATELDPDLDHSEDRYTTRVESSPDAGYFFFDEETGTIHRL